MSLSPEQKLNYKNQWKDTAARAVNLFLIIEKLKSDTNKLFEELINNKNIDLAENILKSKEIFSDFEKEYNSKIEDLFSEYNDSRKKLVQMILLLGEDALSCLDNLEEREEDDY